MIRRILVGLGGTPFSETSTRYAVELAVHQKASLTAVTLFDPSTLDVNALYMSSVLSAAMKLRDEQVRAAEIALDEAMNRVREACSQSKVPLRIRWESGDPFDLLVESARYHDLTICGLRGLFDYGVAVDPKESLVRLIRHGVAPILAVSEVHRDIQRVLVAFSGSVESAKALKTIAQSALWPDADLCIACFRMRPRHYESLFENAMAYCRAHELDPCFHHADTRPDRGILEKAVDWEADLIVLGDGAHNLLARTVLGDTLLEVVRHADRPLLLTH